MDKQKYITISIIIVLFVIFSLVHLYNSKTFDVLNVNSPYNVVLDINKNGQADDNETFELLKDYQVVTKYDNSDDLANALSLSDYQRYSFAYLTEKYSTEVLLDKKVDLKYINGNPEIFLYGERYTDIMKKSGYLFKNNAPINKELFNKRLKQIDKADYHIYNAKSNKYHLMTCEYGREAHNYVILAKSQLPKGASPCQFCIEETDKRQKGNKASKTTPDKCNIAPPAAIYSSGAIKVFLTDHTRNLKPNRLGNTNICNEICRRIDNAKYSIDIAIYGYDRVPKIEKAIQRAINRGVVVRLIYDIDSKNTNIYANTFEFANLIKNCSCDKAQQGVQNPSFYTNSIMHNKFYIFDKSVVITGSANLSHTDMSDFNTNNAILICSKQIAEIYTKEFEQMYNSKFHNLKSKIDNKENIKLGNSIISIYYSPTDEIIKQVFIPLINRAKQYIYIPTFLITDYNLANALISAKSRGVDIKVIVDATNAKNNYSKHKYLREHGITVKTENYAGKLHSKSMIIDDYITVIGSMNFSRSGETKNDENVLVIKDSGLTKFYKAFFKYLWGRIDDFWLTHDVSAEGKYSIGSCTDGIDNDYDGKTDMADEGCQFIKK